VPGQHDLRHHSRVWENTPLGIADASWPVTVVTEPTPYPGTKDIMIYGAGYTDDIQKPDPKTSNILLCHKLIVKSKTPFAFDFSADEIQKKYRYDLIVAGENHEHFINVYQNRHLINCGSLLRTRIDQKHHKPCIYLGEGYFMASLNKLAVPVKAFSAVMDVEKAEEEKQKNEHLVSFIDKIKETRSKGRDETINFAKRLSSRIASKKSDIPKSVTSIIEEVMDDERWTVNR
jgi:predicted phosphodiesterase